MKTKVKARNWPFPKFKAAVVNRMKKAGVKPPAVNHLQKAYDDKLSIPATVLKFVPKKKSS